MIYVLIVVTQFASVGVVAGFGSAEFNNEASCKVAAEWIQKSHIKDYSQVVCLPKGEPR